ncbi:cysteine desulfurase mitochondrial-like [Senna tora]|uniref:Cysteine desulfurase mitochondrial-like n=1 Tax=Senna tora TaxID=362788 RepID=A0A834X712_9FABA|nr:cysteine desulfurase mitochondrial-like [Senna tora]
MVNIKDEEFLVVYEEDEVIDDKKNDVFTLAGKLISTRTVNKGAMENAFRNIWNQPTGFKMEEMDQNMFLFHFKNERDMERVLEGEAWIFRNRWLILARWRRGMDDTEEEFTRVKLWMQLWGAPLHCRTEKMAKKLCSLMGDVLEVGFYEDQAGGTFFMKGLINFSVKNAIQKGANLGNKKDGVFWVDFRYEKIPRCCFSCGMFGHDKGECESMKEAEEKGETFTPKDLGPWVKALGGGRKMTWAGEDKSKNEGVTKSEGHKVGLVRRNDTESLLEKLASMTMKDIDMQNGKVGVDENASVMVEEDSQMDGVIVGSGENDMYGKVEMGSHVGQGVVDDGGKPPMLNQKVKMILKGVKGTKGGVLTWKRVAREKENVVPVTEIKKRLFNDLTNGNNGMEIDDVIMLFGKERNSRRFKNEATNLSGVWLKSTATWEEMSRCGNLGTDVEKREGRIKWVKPASHCFKLNYDAAVRAGVGGAIGGVIRDSEGVVVAAYAVPVKNMLDIHRLEALAIYKGVEVARGLGIQHLLKCKWESSFFAELVMF